jgi:hypothetical protein
VSTTHIRRVCVTTTVYSYTLNKLI